jgi:hypothetical protein
MHRDEESISFVARFFLFFFVERYAPDGGDPVLLASLRDRSAAK